MGRDERDEDQRDVQRRSRQTGGDAPAAGSVEEREDVARDLVEDQDGDDEG